MIDAGESSDSGTDSSYDTPETSETSPQSPSNLNDQENSKKRKRKSTALINTRWTRLRVHYNDKYREFYNETANELIDPPPIHDDELLPPSQIGVTQWSSQEKEIFFTTLAKKGRGDLSGIASAIGTKNELEVHVYLKLLQNAMVNQHLHDHHDELFDVSAAPAALEVSPACSAALALSAEALCILHQKAEAKFEKKKRPDMWLLNRKLGRWASLCSVRGRRGEKEIRKRLPAAELLDLENFLDLSRKIFMNSSEPDENWREFCCLSHEWPSILFTAFGDFHRLVVSLTRRLIQSSLFFAQSRLRAMAGSGFVPVQEVKKQDIVVALSVLGMKHNSWTFWAGVAKRCALIVYDDEHDTEVDDTEVVLARLSSSEVEQRLSQGGLHDEDDASEDLDTDDVNESASTESSIFSASSARDDPNISGYTSNRSDGGFSSADSGSSPNSPTVLNQDLDIYAEALDAKASLKEEKRLWKLLNKQLPEPLNRDDIVVPRVPNGERKTGDDLDEWRAWTDYAPEWETYTKAIPEASFTSNLIMHNGKESGGKGIEDPGCFDETKSQNSEH